MSKDYLPDWTQSDLVLEKNLCRGDSGTGVRRVQEWLNILGHHLNIDGDYGFATEHEINILRRANFLTETGIVNVQVFEILNRGLRQALKLINPIPFSFRGLVLATAEQHLSHHPVEVGGQNKGPWVRLYMQGNEGSEWAWCNGFVSFVIHQACRSLDYQPLMPYFYGVDFMARWAMGHDIFILGPNASAKLKPGDLFITRHKTNVDDWIHTGIVTETNDNTFGTIEGNTNDEGSREGYEMCRRTRGYGGKDFISMET